MRFVNSFPMEGSVKKKARHTYGSDFSSSFESMSSLETDDVVNGKLVIRLKEWTPTEVKLSDQDIDEMTAVCIDKLGKGRNKSKTEKRQKLISVERCSAQRHLYTVTPKNVVGIIELSTKVIVIQPKISVDNILFLICYSWDTSDWRTSNNLFDEIKDASVHALARAIATAFMQRSTKVLKRGILQGYRQTEECLSTIRGRVRWTDQIRAHFGRMPPVECAFEEFTEDVEENRLIKAAVFVLQKTRNLSMDQKAELRRIDNKLDAVTLVEYNPLHLPEIHFTQLNEYYKPLVELAKFILRNFTWTLQHGSFEAPTFLLYMPKIFEDFVVNALRETKAMQELRANTRNFPQNKPLLFDKAGTIHLKPDLSFWEADECCFVGDCKYKRLRVKKKGEMMNGFEEDVNALSSDLYQLLSYTSSTKLTEGLLIYATDTYDYGVAKPITHPDIEPIHSGITLKRVSINLHSKPDRILEQMEQLAKQISASIKRTMEIKKIKNPRVLAQTL